MLAMRCVGRHINAVSIPLLRIPQQMPALAPSPGGRVKPFPGKSLPKLLGIGLFPEAENIMPSIVFEHDVGP